MNPNIKTYAILEECCDFLYKMLQGKGHGVIICLVPQDFDMTNNTWIAFIDCGITQDALQFNCTITISCAPCGKLFVEIKGCDNVRGFRSKARRIKLNNITGRDYHDIPYMKTTYCGKKVTPEVIISDFMWKYNTTIQNIHNINPN